MLSEPNYTEFFEIEKTEEFILSFKKVSKENKAIILLQRTFRRWKMRKYRNSLNLIIAIKRAVTRAIFNHIKLKSQLNKQT